MPRRFYLPLIILLLIGGGGGVFYFHLRNHAPPKFSEVEVFLEQPPTSGGWEKIWRPSRDSGCGIVRTSWIQLLNPFDDGTPISEKSYFFRRSDAGIARLYVTYESESGKVSKIIISSDPADAADAGEFQRLLLGKFPNLRHVVQVNP